MRVNIAAIILMGVREYLIMGGAALFISAIVYAFFAAINSWSK